MNLFANNPLTLQNQSIVYIMADIKFSGTGIVAMNGSFGATTITRNYYGYYQKARLGAPTATAYLTAWRAIVGSMTTSYQALSDSARLKWYDLYVKRRDKLASLNILSAFDLYMSTNLNLLQIGLPALSSPPASFSPLQGEPPSLTSPLPNTLRLLINGAGAIRSAIYISAYLPVGRMSTNQVYRYLMFYISYGFNLDITANVTARIGAPVSGTKIYLKSVPINTANGIRGVAKFDSVIIL